MRWLVHLRARDLSAQYPLVETWDGFPDGTQLHWTLPMEWVLRGLNAMAAPWLPQAHGFEAGALCAGPVLAVAALLVFAWLAVGLLGPAAGLACGAFYTLAHPVSSMSMAGNGDHQTLQHFLLLAGIAAWFLSRDRGGSRRMAMVSGVALGGAVWVSVESMAVIALLGLAAGVSAAVAGKAASAPRRDEWTRAAALTVTLLVAHGLEDQSLTTLHWDRVSWWTNAPALAYLTFLVLRSRMPAWRAALVPAAAAALAVWLLPGGVAAVIRELARLNEAYRWTHGTVDEYRSSFCWHGTFFWYAAVRRFTWLLPALPLLAFACARTRALPAGLRAELTVLATGAFALAAFQFKLLHVFGICLPLWVFLGGRSLLAALLPRAAGRIAAGAMALVAVALAAASRPDRQPETEATVERGIEELCAALAARGGSGEASVLAPWELGAGLLYHARVPVVASGYHRNLAGIRDGYRAFLSQPEDAGELGALLRRRRVRWVVAWPERGFLESAPPIAGVPGGFVVRTEVEVRVTERGVRSLYWRLGFGGQPIPGFRLSYASERQVQLPGGDVVPLFLVYERR